MAESDRDTTRPRVLPRLLLGITAASFAAILVRLAHGQGIPPLSIAAWRLVFACAVLLPYGCLARPADLRGLSGREWGLSALSGVLLGLHFASWIASLAYTTVASSVVLGSTGPLFVGLGSWLALRERPSRRLALGLLVALLGAALIGWGDFGGDLRALWGDLLALGGAVTIAGYLMLGRRLRVGRPLVAYITPVYATAMVTLVLLALCAGSPLAGFPAAGWGWLLCLGLGPQLIGHSSFNWALRHMSATHVAMATLAEPIGASLLAWGLFGEAPGGLVIAGGVATLAGLWIGARG